MTVVVEVCNLFIDLTCVEQFSATLVMLFWFLKNQNLGFWNFKTGSSLGFKKPVLQNHHHNTYKPSITHSNIQSILSPYILIYLNLNDNHNIQSYESHSISNIVTTLFTLYPLIRHKVKSHCTKKTKANTHLTSYQDFKTWFFVSHLKPKTNIT